MFTRASVSLAWLRRVVTQSASTASHRIKSSKFTASLGTGVIAASGLCAWHAFSPASCEASFLTEELHKGPMVDAVARAMPAVVRIMGRAPGNVPPDPEFSGFPNFPSKIFVFLCLGRPVGSGFLISEDGYIVSNHHVVVNMRPEVCAGIEIHFENGDVYMAELVASDPRADIAVLKIVPFTHDMPLPKFPYLKPGRSSQLVRGEWVAALGAMLGGLLTFSQGPTIRLVFVMMKPSFTSQACGLSCRRVCKQHVCG